ncbi:MAG TPA: DUF309 domain-containing protein [Egibacteraceae bacterium]|nr:DUF309 domain-containing protein [Egibacteraceae bacterium]
MPPHELPRSDTGFRMARAGERPRDRFGRPLPRGARDELPGRQDPDDVVTTVDEAFAQGAVLFDAGRFFEAHEFFEWIWKCDAVDPADRDFWKGVTQVAVGCVHTQRRNATGALTLLERAAGHLDPYPSPHLGVDTAALAAAARAVAAVVRNHGPSPELAFPRLPRTG